MDSIGDTLTIIRNASSVKKADCILGGSRMNESIVSILKKEGYIADFSETTRQGHKAILVTLKYLSGQPAIQGIQRHSKPGCRRYYSYKEVPYTLDSLGIGILSTSRGILTDKEARLKKVGGELLCKVW
ncbi:MAG: 30S ribosomal protein S8 [Verrucomicrobia bacterium GWF2_51_19]|nr:MAG: 30S ribosomal protein S8 [Verrucomicrobia bacterium GWF2_51_19]HCJ12586.1 30S ribosomal protein S8 [Opitutae bacterium]